MLLRLELLSLVSRYHWALVDISCRFTEPPPLVVNNLTTGLVDCTSSTITRINVLNVVADILELLILIGCCIWCVALTYNI